MSKYIVLKTFSDLDDDNHIYQEGDKYPRQGKAKKSRVDELSSTNNKLGEVLIVELESDK